MTSEHGVGDGVRLALVATQAEPMRPCAMAREGGRQRAGALRHTSRLLGGCTFVSFTQCRPVLVVL